MDRYRLAVNFLGETKLEDDLALIRRVGYDGVFFIWKPDVPENHRAVLAARDAGLAVTSFHAPFTRTRAIWHGDEEQGGSATRELIDCVRQCAGLEVPVTVLHAFCGFLDHEPTEIGLERYGRIVRAAEEYGVTLAFENTEGEEYLAAIFARYGDSPRVGFCFDTGHEQVYNGGKDMMALYGNKLAHTHFNDNQGTDLPIDRIEHTFYRDLHQVMGDGIVNWKGVMDRIGAVGYDGFLTCELTHRGTDYYPGTHDRYRAMTPEQFLKYTYDRMVAVCERRL